MNQSIRRILALLRKEMKDNLKSPHVLPILFVPIIIALSYRFISFPSDNIMMITSPVAMAIFMIAGMLPASSLAEEKEKGTLRMLIHSPAKLPEIMIGKNLFFMLLCTLICFICLWIVQVSLSVLPFLAVFIPTMLFFLLLSSAVALYANAQSQVTSILLPVTLFLFFIATMEPIYNVQIISTINHAFPFKHFYDGLTYSSIGGPFPFVGLLVISAWLLLACLLLFILYRRQQYD